LQQRGSYRYCQNIKYRKCKKASPEKKPQKKRKKNKENSLARKDLRDIMTRNELAYLLDNP